MKCACILAAGVGSRLKKYTNDRTKGMVEVNGEPLINYSVRSLIEGGVTKFYIVTGHFADELMRHLNTTFSTVDIEYIQNDDYSTTNNIYSLHLALPHLFKYDEIVLIESDLWVRHEEALSFLKDSRSNLVLASPFQYWMDGTCITINENTHEISGFVSKSDIHRFVGKKLYKTVNWYKFSGAFLRSVYKHFIDAYVESFGKNAYYEDVLKVIASVNPKLFNSYLVHDNSWMEVDDADDLSRATQLSAGINDKVEMLVNRFGGYWKYSFFDDLTLLVNPHFPTDGMMDEMISASRQALREYPSNLATISRIASKTLSCDEDEILVGNGASELMSILSKVTAGREYIICPPFFMEYHRLFKDTLTVFPRAFPSKSMKSSILEMVEMSRADLIIVNPNNPTGEFCERDFLEDVLSKLKDQGRRLILDESFIDFFESSESLLNSKTLHLYNNLIIIKSYGKSFGVPGLRLGIIASADLILLSDIKNYLPIWNVSSTAEVFLDLLPRYINSYKESLAVIKSEREWLEERLQGLGLDLYKSRANFVLFKLEKDLADYFQEFSYQRGMLVKKLFERNGLDGTFFRVAVRERSQNEKLIEVIEDFISKYHSCPNAYI